MQNIGKGLVASILSVFMILASLYGLNDLARARADNTLKDNYNFSQGKALIESFPELLKTCEKAPTYNDSLARPRACIDAFEPLAISALEEGVAMKAQLASVWILPWQTEQAQRKSSLDMIAEMQIDVASELLSIRLPAVQALYRTCKNNSIEALIAAIDDEPCQDVLISDKEWIKAYQSPKFGLLKKLMESAYYF